MTNPDRYETIPKRQLHELISMSDKLNIILMYNARVSNRKIAAELGIDKNTVNRNKESACGIYSAVKKVKVK